MKRKGFSLLELILVLAVGSAVALIKFQNLKSEQEAMVSKAAGAQIKQIGDAVNGYINIKYDKISTLTTSTGSGNDPGPRICSASSCTITYQTLINEGLLPASFNGMNVNKSSYSIILLRTGTVPNYIVNGLITTTTPWNEGGKLRYDLLGKAMQEAGIDSGMTQSPTVATGFQGEWSENSSVFSNINSAGLLAYRVGYDSAMYSVYLRRDGTLPMTGDLNMGGNSISNIKNITASGDEILGGNITVNGNTSLKGTVNINGTTTVNAPLFVWNDIVGNKIHANGNIEGQNLALVYGATIGSSLMVGNFSIPNDLAGWIQASGDIKSVNGDLYGNKLHIQSIKTVGTNCTGINEGLGTYARDSSGFILSCINGLWTETVVNGNYVPVGSYSGSYSATNNTGKPFKIYAYGGNPPPRKISSGNADDCANTYALIGIVNGITVSNATSANSEWGKSGNIVFDVPAGSSWSIVSNGMRDYGCGAGSFSMISYQ
ncbi:prepilin-type N-terminal cleavage/methylation domain-containing protein [Citrobacter meridianamericanus]|uniref:Prepilin-type N-terminal cleavage/methylation domain-containing protein n=1 Tax=Citrobacter meridianamericanus TaxID=2894201 RepID=A0ABT1B8P4_9ENTR|nr:prepilin-type N-terminal cleavage/methylation domain-containing protein [Citrobacter meridianamericanus]MCO5781384.1 prepilin-type N-terminal cleavage/methylation domain-containing protein [Citrobacter meridianamericanus]